MKKKTLKGLQEFAKLTPVEKTVGIAAVAAAFPIALTLSVYKKSQKKKRRRR